jgi:hypothetical protein
LECTSKPPERKESVCVAGNGDGGRSGAPPYRSCLLHAGQSLLDNLHQVRSVLLGLGKHRLQSLQLLLQAMDLQDNKGGENSAKQTRWIAVTPTQRNRLLTHLLGSKVQLLQTHDVPLAGSHHLIHRYTKQGTTSSISALPLPPVTVTGQ